MTAPSTYTAAELRSLNVGRLVTALDWVARNYETTLACKPVHDADECLAHAALLVADYERDLKRAQGAA